MSTTLTQTRTTTTASRTKSYGSLCISTASVEELVLASKENDRAAFGELVRRFEGAVYAIALRRLKNTAEADELVQEVFIRAMQKIDQLKTPAAFAGWLRAIAGRMAINRIVRRSPVMTSSPELMEATCEDTQSPVEDLLLAERKSQVHAGLARLGGMDRDTLVAFYMDGQTLVEMSRDFASPVGTIKRRLHVARKRLAKELESLAV